MHESFEVLWNMMEGGKYLLCTYFQAKITLTEVWQDRDDWSKFCQKAAQKARW